MSLSVVVITLNEEANIGRCLKSVAWADEIVVLDSQSSDRTVDIAREFGAKVHTSAWKGYGPAKQEAVGRAAGPWILSLDADEEVTGPLADEIREVVDGATEYDGFYISRRTNFLGRWIQHCGWYPDWVLRLFRKDRGNFSSAPVHEKVEVNGRVGRLSGQLRHYSYPSLETYLAKSSRYTTMGAQEAWRRGKRATWFDLAARPAVSFFSHYVVRQGFRDGAEGFLISVLSSVAVMVKYAKLRQMQKASPAGGEELHAEEN